MKPPLTPLLIEDRFMGPPGSANGGCTAGRLAAYVHPAGVDDEDAPAPYAVRVTLRQPPPLETPLTVTPLTSTGQGAGVRASFGGAVVAEAKPATLSTDPAEPVSYGRAVEAAARYPGLVSHPFTTCFVCGTGRHAPDALALAPGPVEGRERDRACPWVPGASLPRDAAGRIDPSMVWAALDCPGGWTLDLTGRPAVLGRMTAQIDATPEPGERCVIVGVLLGRDGRKAFTATTAYDGEGRVLGRAEHVWLEVDPAAFGAARATRSTS